MGDPGPLRRGAASLWEPAAGMTVTIGADAELVRRIRWEPTAEGRQSLASERMAGHQRSRRVRDRNGLRSGHPALSRPADRRAAHAVRAHGDAQLPLGAASLPRRPRRRAPADRRARAGGQGDRLLPRISSPSGWKPGLPVWEYDVEGVRFEKRVLMPHLQNTTHISYSLLSSEPVRLELRPLDRRSACTRRRSTIRCRRRTACTRSAIGSKSSRAATCRRCASFSTGTRRRSPSFPRLFTSLAYELEQHRGYECCGDLWSPGYFRLTLTPGHAGGAGRVDRVVGDDRRADAAGSAARRAPPARAARRGGAHGHAATAMAAELVLAADQFIITPAGRVEEAARARAMGDEVRTVIAGYHWFTDWGRDTMISLEGLTLCTGRQREAGYILRTFGHYVRDGLIPNMFPEGTKEGLYHTADATLWFFHAIHRYLLATDDRSTLRQLLPKLKSIVEHHVAGTRFGIGVDPADGLLRQGAEGYQLTWMDAKVDDWVVTPRRGKAGRDQRALVQRAATASTEWLREEGDPMALADARACGTRARVVQPALLVRRGRLPLRRGRRRAGRRSGLPSESDLCDLARSSGARAAIAGDRCSRSSASGC